MPRLAANGRLTQNEIDSMTTGQVSDNIARLTADLTDRASHGESNTELLTGDLKAALAILREFVADVNAVGRKQVGREWPDISITFVKAEQLLIKLGTGGHVGENAWTSDQFGNPPEVKS